MEKLKRSERIVLMTKKMIENPGEIYTLGYFSELYKAAKSSISEDLSIIKDTLENAGQGLVNTISGAAGGVVFHPYISDDKEEVFLTDLAKVFAQGERILPGGYLYMTDVVYTPSILKEIGKIFIKRFKGLTPDYVVTVETKGIPIALSVAETFNVPLVIIRDSSRVTEGSAVNINYVSGSNRKIETMSLAKKSLPENAKVIVIDDFMKAGGTAKGMVDLLGEFNADVLGLGVLMTTREPESKLVEDCMALLELVSLDEQKRTVEIVVK